MITWLIENWEHILAVYGAFVAFATIIVKWTKTDKDDIILNKIISFLDNFSTAFSKADAKKLNK